MLKFFILFFLYALVTYAQMRPSFIFSPAVMRENGGVFKFKRPAGYNAKYNLGIGADMHLDFSKFNGNSGTSFGPSIGQYYFWNNQIKTFDYNFEYKENNLVTPICFNAGFGNFTPNNIKARKFLYSVSISAGGAYVQNSIVGISNHESIYTTKWAGIFKLSVYIKAFMGKRSFPITFGLQYVNLDRKSFGSTFY